MLIALIADIHANRLALDACLAKAKSLAASRFVFLGDLVGYGAEPEEVVASVMAMAEDGAAVVMGNHDQAAVAGTAAMNEAALRAIVWTAGQLSSKAKTFLAGLPMTATDGDVLFVHADASAPQRWLYVRSSHEARRSLAATRASVTFCGHTHVPALFCSAPGGRMVVHRPITDAPIPLSSRRQWLAVIGSAGQPRDGNPAAAFATYETETRVLTHRRAPYDVEAAARRIRAAGLPEVLAARLLRGR